jgi:hypothetical protein
MDCKRTTLTELANSIAHISQVTSEEHKQYVAIIDNILRESDLKTISAKAIRKALSDKLGKDISAQKVRLPTTPL